MKKIVVAIDSFKGSLSTFEAGRAIEEAAKEVYKNTEVKISPIAFLVITDGNIRLINVSDSPNDLDKIFTKIPELIDQVSGLISKKKNKEE